MRFTYNSHIFQKDIFFLLLFSISDKCKWTCHTTVDCWCHFQHTDTIMCNTKRCLVQKFSKKEKCTNLYLYSSFMPVNIEIKNCWWQENKSRKNCDENFLKDINIKKNETEKGSLANIVFWNLLKQDFNTSKFL